MLYGETFRSIRTERKSVEDLNFRRNEFWNDSETTKNKEIKTLRLLKKNLNFSKPHFKAAKPLDSHPK